MQNRSNTPEEALEKLSAIVARFCDELAECKEDISQFTRFGTASFDDLRSTLVEHWLPRRAEDVRIGIENKI